MTVKVKPTIELAGRDGNIFFIIARAQKALRRIGEDKAALAMQQRIDTEAEDYDVALAIVLEYVNTD